MPKKNVDVELLATWMDTAARTLGVREVFRKIISKAATDAAELYQRPDNEETCDDEQGVRRIIARFASTADENSRILDEDDKMEEEE